MQCLQKIDDEPTYVVIRKEVAELWANIDNECTPYRNYRDLSSHR